MFAHLAAAAPFIGTHVILSTPLISHTTMQPMRLLAVVIAKNAVGSSWRKTLGTR